MQSMKTAHGVMEAPIHNNRIAQRLKAKRTHHYAELDKTKSEFSPSYKRFKMAEEKRSTGLGLVDDDEREEGEAELEENQESGIEMFGEEGENEQIEDQVDGTEDE